MNYNYVIACFLDRIYYSFWILNWIWLGFYIDWDTSLSALYRLFWMEVDRVPAELSFQPQIYNYLAKYLAARFCFAPNFSITFQNFSYLPATLATKFKPTNLDNSAISFRIEVTKRTVKRRQRLHLRQQV